MTLTATTRTDVTTDSDAALTVGHLAERHARQLLTALAVAGAPGILVVGLLAADDPDAAAGPHRVWPFVSLRLRASAVRVYCMPTSAGAVLLIETRTERAGAYPPGVRRCRRSAPPLCSPSSTTSPDAER